MSSEALGRAESLEPLEEGSGNGVKGPQGRKERGALQVVRGDAVVRLNVGGTLHQVRRSTLMSHPDSLLGRIFAPGSAMELPDVVDGGFFFDRSPAWFPHILEIYRTERLGCRIPKDKVGPISLELTFWGFDNSVVPPLMSIKNAEEVAATCLEREKNHVEEFAKSFLNMQPGSVLDDVVDAGESSVNLVLGCTRFAEEDNMPFLEEKLLPFFTRNLPTLFLNPNAEKALCESLDARRLTAKFTPLGTHSKLCFCYYCDDEDGTQVRARYASCDNKAISAIPSYSSRVGGIKAIQGFNYFLKGEPKVLTIGWTKKPDAPGTPESDPGFSLFD